jgi:hypothetical protein
MVNIMLAIFVFFCKCKTGFKTLKTLTQRETFTLDILKGNFKFLFSLSVNTLSLVLIIQQRTEVDNFFENSLIFLIDESEMWLTFLRRFVF